MCVATLPEFQKCRRNFLENCFFASLIGPRINTIYLLHLSIVPNVNIDNEKFQTQVFVDKFYSSFAFRKKEIFFYSFLREFQGKFREIKIFEFYFLDYKNKILLLG